MGDLAVEVSCPACGRPILVAFSELREDSACCPACGTAAAMREEQIDAAVDRRMRAEPEALKPKFRRPWTLPLACLGS